MPGTSQCPASPPALPRAPCSRQDLFSLHKGFGSSTCTTSTEAPGSWNGISGVSTTSASKYEGTGAHWEEVDRYLPALFETIVVSPLPISCLDVPAGWKGLAEGLSSMQRRLLAKSRARGATPPCKSAAPEHQPALLRVTCLVGSQNRCHSTPWAGFTGQSSHRAANN